MTHALWIIFILLHWFLHTGSEITEKNESFEGKTTIQTRPFLWQSEAGVFLFSSILHATTLFIYVPITHVCMHSDRSCYHDEITMYLGGRFSSYAQGKGKILYLPTDLPIPGSPDGHLGSRSSLMRMSPGCRCRSSPAPGQVTCRPGPPWKEQHEIYQHHSNSDETLMNFNGKKQQLHLTFLAWWTWSFRWESSLHHQRVDHLWNIQLRRCFNNLHMDQNNDWV